MGGGGGGLKHTCTELWLYSKEHDCVQPVTIGHTLSIWCGHITTILFTTTVAYLKALECHGL